MERAAFEYLREGPGLEAIADLLRDRLEPGYDVNRIEVRSGQSIEIIAAISVAYSLLKDFNEVIDTLRQAALHLRDIVHGVLGAFGGPNTHPTVALSVSPLTAGLLSSASTESLALQGPIAGISLRHILVALGIVTYLAALFVLLAFLLSLF